jgi:hypothetical protein
LTAKIIVRDFGSKKPDYGLFFEFPELPKVGDYISIERPDNPSPWGEDLIVRHIWWRLKHTETRPTAEREQIGTVNEIFIECDKAIGPWASDRWRDHVTFESEKTGVPIEHFDVKRLSYRESQVFSKPSEGES